MTPDPDLMQTVRGFPVTSWSLVRRARGVRRAGVAVGGDAGGGKPGDDGARQAEAALEELCRAYWRPLYAYARGRGLARADAQDAVQDFFATALRRELFQRADEAAGKLRSFLLTALKHHLQDRAAHEGAARRRPEGGWAELDFAAAEAEWARTATGGTGGGGSGAGGVGEASDAAYERQWARALLAQAMARLEARYAAEGKRDVFEALRGEALDEAEPAAPSAPTTAVAADTKAKAKAEANVDKAGAGALSPGARRVAVHRLRKRFVEALRAVVADTLPEGGDVDAELRELGAALREERA